MLGAQRAWDTVTVVVWACLLSLQDCWVHGRGAATLGLKQDPFSAEPQAGPGSQVYVDKNFLQDSQVVLSYLGYAGHEQAERKGTKPGSGDGAGQSQQPNCNLEQGSYFQDSGGTAWAGCCP